MKACIFCDQKPLTREHLFPEWISRLLLKAKKDSGFENKGYRNVVSGTKFQKSWDMTVFDDTIHCVCKRCNNGWMAALDERAKPLLVKVLVFHEPLAFTTNEQELIAAWCMLRGIILEYYHPGKDDHFYTEAERKSFAATLRPPDNSLIFAAQYFGISAASADRRRILFRPKNLQPTPANTHYLEVATFCVCQLAFQVVALRRPDNSSANPLTSNIWRHIAAQIWPVDNTKLRWPMPFILNDNGLNLFRDRFSPSHRGGLIFPPRQ